MLLEYLLKPIAEPFRPAAFPNHKDLMANRAFARSGQAYLKSGDQFRFFKHASCCHRFAEGILPVKVPCGRPRPQQRVLRSQFEIAAAEVLAASGKPANLQAATASLKAVMQEAEKKGILGVLYEARLALGKAEMKHGNKEDGRTRLAEVERDASASGFVLIRRKAATAL